MEAEGPDGTIFEFPDDVHPDIIKNTISRHYGAQANPAADVAQGFAGGAERGIAGVAGLPGTVSQGLNTAADFLARQTAGRVYNRFAPGGTGDWSADTRPDPGLGPHMGPQDTLPTSADTVGAYEAIRGPTYRSPTTAGQIAGTVGEFVGGNAVVPGAALPKIVSGVSGALGSEAAGRYIENTPAAAYKPLAQVAGGILAPMAAGGLITPLRTDPSRAASIARLEAEGITPTAGQKTGTNWLRRAESALGEVPLGAPDPAIGQQEQLTRAMGRRMGVDEGALTPTVMQETHNRLKQTIGDIASRNVMKTDPQFAQDLSDVLRNQFTKVTVAQRQDFLNAARSLSEEIAASGGQLPGEAYQSARSFLGQRANELRNSDASASAAYKGLQATLDGAFGRSMEAAGNAPDVAAYNQWRQQYAGMKAAETAVTKVPQGTPEGMVTPNSIDAAAAQSSSVAQRARGQSDLGQLAKDARSVLTTPPNSGTAGRLNVLQMAGGLAGGIGGALGGGPIGALGGAGVGAFSGAKLGELFGPTIASNLVNRRLPQQYLGNQLLPGGVLSGARALVNAQNAIGLERPVGILGPTENRRRIPAR
jgi:hypothetical protein